MIEEQKEYFSLFDLEGGCTYKDHFATPHQLIFDLTFCVSHLTYG
jgi:hypothetical protein